MKNKILLIYHKEDNDGLFSAAIIIDALSSSYQIGDFDLIGTDYVDMNRLEESEVINNFKDDYEYLILTDISFKPATMKKLYSDFGNKMFWFDHHRPIIKESFKNHFDAIAGLRDTNHSSLYNAWMYYNNPLKEPNIVIPELYKILSAWDSFTYEQEGYTLEYVKEANIGTTTIYLLDIKKIINLVAAINNKKLDSKLVINNLLTIGKVCVMHDNAKNDMLMKTSLDEDWTVSEDRKAVALFCAGPSNSEMFASLKNTEYKNALVFKITGSEKVVVSLYNINDEDDWDCGDYMLKTYKGGGHVGAAGCNISKSKFFQIMKKKVF